jgi:hypothetical protein
MTEERLVAVISKNSRELIQVTVGARYGRTAVSVRTWYWDEAGILRPGRGGIGFKVELAEAVGTALIEAAAVARRDGALP